MKNLFDIVEESKNKLDGKVALNTVLKIIERAKDWGERQVSYRYHKECPPPYIIPGLIKLGYEVIDNQLERTLTIKITYE